MATLLGAVLYDPATAANKATTAASVMAVLDATNLTLAITVPASGIIRVVMRTVIDGAATYPQILLGVMNHTGGTILGRVAPVAQVGGTALATTRMALMAEFTITGLTPGALQLDAAFAVEFAVAATAIRWGGPNNTTASDAWGAFQFEIWDPNGMPGITAGWLTAAGIAASALNGKGDWNVGKTGYAISATGLNLQTAWTVAITGNITGNLSGSVGSVTGAVGSVTGNVGGNVTGSVGSVQGAVGSVTGLTAANLDVAVSTRLAAASYTAPNNAGVTAIQAKTDNLPSDPADQSLIIAATDAIFSRLGAPAGASVSADVAAVKADSAAIKLKTDNLPGDPADASDIAARFTTLDTAVADLPTNGELATALAAADDAVLTQIALVRAKTDGLTFTVAGLVDGNLQRVNDTLVSGTGTVGDPWGPT